MKAIIAFLLMGLTMSLWAGDSEPDLQNNILLNRLRLNTQLEENLQSELQEEVKIGASQKSIGKAVLFSAVLPGAGQFYAQSYWKALAFVAVEATAWAINISNNKKGDDKTSEFIDFADQNWSEQRYWSYVYYKLNGRVEDPNFPTGVYDNLIQPDEANRPVIIDEVWQTAEEDLEPFATTEYLRGFSHHLPDEKTQQYYEMIGKYPEQFGNAWADASFDVSYRGAYGGVGNITPMNDLYTTMRLDANNFYNKAGYGTMIALVNHLVSAIDAGFTTRSFNRKQVELTYRQDYYFGEFLNMFGLNLAF